MDFDIHLMQAGFTAKKGQIIDASFVQVPKQKKTTKQKTIDKSDIIPDQLC